MLRRFILNDKLKVIIEDNALNDMYKYKPERYCHENGGVLLGKFNKNENTYIISNVSTTNPEDKKGRNFFIRNKRQAQIIINKFWKKSKGEINYLGEWHTHNENYPTPSFTDKHLVQQILNNKNIEIENVFMVILGRKNELYICTIDSKKEIQQLREE